MNFFVKKRKILIFTGIIVAVLFFSRFVSAYDETIVHPSLTEEAAKLYNLNYGDKLTEQEIGWIKQGSIDEDKIWGVIKQIRSSNHFYNPFGIKEWKDYDINEKIPAYFSSGIGMGSKQWAHDSVAQSQYVGGDYTWERAIWDYANGDKRHAYESLGHILHLIEDKTVPAHARNDFHLSPKELEAYKDLLIIRNFVDYEPYESWTGNQAKAGILDFDFSRNLFQQGKKPVILSSLDEYFDNVALYANTKFFSQDTIYVYSEPNNSVTEGSEKLSNGDIVDYVYGLDGNGKKVKLAKIFEDKTTKQKLYDISDKTPEIHSDYWSRLAPKSILAGAGIIKLFKDEAKKSGQNPAAVRKPDTFATYYIAKPIALAAANLKSGASATSTAIAVGINRLGLEINNLILSAQAQISAFAAPSSKALVFDFSVPPPDGVMTVEEIIRRSQLAGGTAQAKISEAPPDSNSVGRTKAKAPEIVANVPPLSQPAAKTSDSADAAGSGQNENSKNNNDGPASLLPSPNPDKDKAAETGSDGQNANIQNNNSAEPAPDIPEAGEAPRRRSAAPAPPETAIIEFPPKLASSPTAVFKFSSSADNSSFLCGLDNGEFSACSENQIYENLADGEHNLKVKAVGQFFHTDETPVEYSWKIDTIPPAKIADFIAETGDKRGTINLSWTAGETGATYKIRYAEKEIAEMGATAEQINWQDAGQILEAVDNSSKQIEVGSATLFYLGKQYFFAVKTKDEAGNFSEISNIASAAANANAEHLVISEIQVAGPAGQAENEFVEIYNPTSEDINLETLPLKLHIINSTGKSDVSKDISFINSTIKSHGYFLIASRLYSGAVNPDATYSTSGNSLVADGAVYIGRSDKDKESIIDLVGWGAQPEGGYEKNPFPGDVPKNQSIERKADFSSTAGTLAAGADKYLGNSWDSDDNSADFVLQSAPNPQNSQSFPEPRFAPEKIANFSATGTADDSHAVKLLWLAPYGAFGTPENLNYDIRYSMAEITPENFIGAIAVPDPPPANPPGSLQEIIIGNLSLNQTYYFAIKTKDSTGLESEIAAVSYSFPSAQSVSPWPAYKGNNQRTGQSAYNGPAAPNLKWKHLYGGWAVNSPSIDQDGNLYLWSCGARDSNGKCEYGSGYGYLISLSPEGVLNWKSESRYFENTPALDAEGNILFSFADVISKNSGENGKVIKRVGTETDSYGASALNSALSSPDGAVYFASGGGTTLLSFSSGLDLKWENNLGGHVWGSPAQDKDGNVYVGAVIWTMKTETDPTTGRRLYDPENSFYRVFSFDSRGNLRWQSDLAAVKNQLTWPEFLTPAIGDARGYISAENAVYSFDLSDGRPELVYQVFEEGGSRRYGGSPSLASDGTLYVAFTDGYFYALNPGAAAGEILKWKKQIAPTPSYYQNYYHLNSSAIAADGTVYIGGENTFYAIAPGGTEKWRYSVAGDFPEGALVYAGTPAIGKDGVIYVSFGGVYAASKGGQGILYAFGPE